MLNKEICKRCWSQRHVCLFWDANNEYWWERGICWCVVDSRNWTDVLGEPPKNCHYFLEQMLYSMPLEEKGKKDVE